MTPVDLEALDDDAFLNFFESCGPALECWNHRAHVRMAWNYLQRHSFDQALTHIRDGIRRFNAHHNVPDELERGYHETLTVAWTRIIAATIRHRGPSADSRAFCNENPHLCARTLLRLYYTRAGIVNLDAKARFVEPDVAPLP